NTSIIVRRSNCKDAFGASEIWAPFDAPTWNTYLADANGDGCAALIDVEQGQTIVRVAQPCPAAPGTPAQFNPTFEAWTTNGFYGDAAGPYFADVTGDGKADAIVLNRGNFGWGLAVRRSDGTRFLDNEFWSGN